MYVCICKGVTDSQIRQSLQNGASCLRDVRRELGVATQCCKCLPLAREVINQTLAEKEAAYTPLFTAPSLFYPAAEA